MQEIEEALQGCTNKDQKGIDLSDLKLYNYNVNSLIQMMLFKDGVVVK